MGVYGACDVGESYGSVGTVAFDVCAGWEGDFVADAYRAVLFHFGLVCFDG